MRTALLAELFLLAPAILAIAVARLRSSSAAFHLVWPATFGTALAGALAIGSVPNSDARGLILVGVLGTAVVLARPPAWRDPRELAVILGTTALTGAVLVADDLELAAAAWVASFLPALARNASPSTRRPVLVTAVIGSLPVLAALGLARAAPALGWSLSGPAGDAAYACLVLGAVVRLGIVPFGPLVVAGLTRSGLGRTALVVALRPSVPLLILAGHTFPDAATRLAVPMVWISAVSAVLAGLQGVVQTDPRRSLAAIATTQAGILLAGLSAGGAGHDGALVLWVGLGLAFVGLGLVVEAVESRLGRHRARQARGLMGPLPGLATLLLVFGAAASGFPGTLAFVGEDIVLSAVLDVGLAPAIAVLLATALNGATVVRMFAQMFLGPVPDDAREVPGLVPRERLATLPLAAAIVLGSVVPAALFR